MTVDALKAIAEEAKRRQLERRGVKQSKPRPSAWRSVWAEEMRKHYPEAGVQYTMNEGNNIQQAIRTRGLDPEDIAPFFRWLIQNWAMLRTTVFSRNPKVPRGPEFPVMKFVIVNLAEIHGMYTARRPEIAATLPLARRLHVEPKPATEIKVLPKPKAVRLNPIKYDKPATPVAKPVDMDKAEALRIKLGLPKWKD